MQAQKSKFASVGERCGAVRIWRTYWGLLDEDATEFHTRLYGFDTRGEDPSVTSRFFSLPDEGAAFGFIAAGRVQLSDKASNWTVSAGQWFSLPNGARGVIEANSCLVAMIRVGYKGVYAMGGPVESKGRLRYIDGCSDSLLLAPPILGDPCINLLHFPSGVKQTSHTHPSSRMGIVIAGAGICESERRSSVLTPGDIFLIAKDVHHNFCTSSDSTMNVFAYHPDSDWGPRHEEHPMINRTWVDGTKMEPYVES